MGPRRETLPTLAARRRHLPPHRTLGNLLSGTTIISDGWAAYSGINAMQQGHKHHFVNHKVNFVDLGDEQVHTQPIEATCGALKRKLKGRFGDPEYRLDRHMFNYMFRRFYDSRKHSP